MKVYYNKRMKPLIGITASWVEDSYKLYYAYCHLINSAGGIPVILPYDFKDAARLDALVLSGGGDINPELGGYEKSELLDLVPLERDKAEFTLFADMFALKKPVLGICRGHQVINRALGGTLIRDLHEEGYTEEHSRGEKLGYHVALTEKNSLLHGMLGAQCALWSTHHQAVKEAGDGISITARSPEGVVEGIEHASGLILGMQTHPERMDMFAPFAWLVDMAKVGM